jgi:hypothetical protein
MLFGNCFSLFFEFCKPRFELQILAINQENNFYRNFIILHQNVRNVDTYQCTIGNLLFSFKKIDFCDMSSSLK